MSKVDEIKNQLARRLEQQAMIAQELPQAGARRQERVAAKSTVKSAPLPKTTLPAPAEKSREGVVKLSVSLYDFDIDCLEKIKEFMRQRGVRRLSDSEALRIACRAVSCDNEFLDIYQGMQGEDRRRRKSA